MVFLFLGIILIFSLFNANSSPTTVPINKKIIYILFPPDSNRQRLIFGTTWLYCFISAFCEFLVCESLFSRRTFWCQNKVARMCRCPPQIPAFAKCTLQFFLFLDVVFLFFVIFFFIFSWYLLKWLGCADVLHLLLKCTWQSFFCWNCLISFLISSFFHIFLTSFMWQGREDPTCCWDEPRKLSAALDFLSPENAVLLFGTNPIF